MTWGLMRIGNRATLSRNPPRETLIQNLGRSADQNHYAELRERSLARLFSVQW